MGRCWAGCLGDCDTMSGEHVFSNALFTHGCSCPLVIEGVRRIRNGGPTHNAEKANVLCRRHNSLLSPLDQVAGKVAAFMASANEESFEQPLYIEGELLERWLLKTVVNVAAAGWTGARKLRPSPAIVAAIFGGSPVPNGFGLYSVDGIDPKHRPAGGVSFIPIVFDAKDPKLGGAYVSIHGMPLFAAFNADLAGVLESGAVPHLLQQFSTDGLRHVYRPAAIVMSRKRGRPVVIGLSWGGLLRFEDGTTAPFSDRKPLLKAG
jgi:hypothetical protein